MTCSLHAPSLSVNIGLPFKDTNDTLCAVPERERIGSRNVSPSIGVVSPTTGPRTKSFVWYTAYPSAEIVSTVAPSIFINGIEEVWFIEVVM